MQPTLNTDPRIYGGDAPVTSDLPVTDPQNISGKAPVANPDPVSLAGVGQGSTPSQEGVQIMQANAAREPTPANAQEFFEQEGKALDAAWGNSTTKSVADYINEPSFSPVDGFDPKPLIKNLPFQPTHAELRALSKATSPDEQQFRLQQIQDQRARSAVLADHQALAVVAGFADPIWLGLDLASGGAAGLVGGALGAGRAAQRIGAATIAAGGAAGLGAIEMQQGKIDGKELVANALINGAASSMFVGKTGKLEAHDPTFPGKALTEQAQNMQGVVRDTTSDILTEERSIQPPNPPAIPTVPTKSIPGVPGMRNPDSPGAVASTTDAASVLMRHVDDPDVGPLARILLDDHGDALSGVTVNEGAAARSYYDLASHTIGLEKDAPAWVAVHEATHSLTAAKVDYGLANPDSAHGQIVQELDGLRQQVDQFAKANPDIGKQFPRDNGKGIYYTQNLHEFVAGLFSGDTSSGFYSLLKAMPAKSNVTMVGRVVDAVRRLIGLAPTQESALTHALGLSEDLMNTPLRVKNNHTADEFLLAPNASPKAIAQGVGGWWQKLHANTTAGKVGRAVEWSLSAEMRKYGTEGPRIQRLLVDDPLDMTSDSVTSQRMAIRNDLQYHQENYEARLLKEMANQGAGLWQRARNTGGALQVQGRIERQVQEELVRRDNAVRAGTDWRTGQVDPTITELANLHDKATAAGAMEQKAAGVFGAVDPRAGYFTRKWSITKMEQMENDLIKSGSSQRAARAAIRDMLADGIMKAYPKMEREVAQDMGQAIMHRTRAKGYFEDSLDHGSLGDDGAQEIRAILEGSGLSDARMQRVEDFLTGQKDDAGKVATLKHRIDMDMSTGMQMADGTKRSILDLVDNSLTRNLDSYLDSAAGSAALARKGLVRASDITELRKEWLHSIADEAERKRAAYLFDNTIATLKGHPVGEDLPRAMRKLSAVTSSVGLAFSGLWQTMDYAQIASRYGLVKTATEFLKTMPGLRSMIHDASNPSGARSLADVLTHNSANDMRIRPFMQKLEDNFTIPSTDKALLMLQQTKQLVPYVNGMKYIHYHQARLTANLVMDTVRRAVEGDTKAVEALGRYGLEGHTLDALRADVKAHGLTVDKWSDGAWASIRGPVGKMMDDAVLRNRTGEIPAFAQFSQLGKFIFTFRTFVLGAHNKMLAGTLGRQGFAGLGLMALYQFPLAMASSYAVSVMQGKPETDMNKLALSSAAQMSAMGLFSELWGVASGQKQQFGTAGLMAIDKLYKFGGQAFAGNIGGATASVLQATPLLAIMPFMKALGESLK